VATRRPAGYFGGKEFAAGRTRELIETFASRAYRRPARTEEVDRLMAVVTQRGKEGRSPLDALKDDLKRRFARPRFFISRARAWRASRPKTRRYRHTHWRRGLPISSGPRCRCGTDRAGTKRRVAEVRSARGTDQTLVASPKSEAFVVGFLDSWLNLRSLGDMPPDRTSSSGITRKVFKTQCGARRSFSPGTP